MADTSPAKRSRPDNGDAVTTSTDSQTKPILYSYWRSSCSWRVRIALNALGVETAYKAVHLVKNNGEQHAEEYQAKNSMREVPTLFIDGRHLTQSLSIIEYLNETRNGKLLPSDPGQRQKVRAVSDLIAQGIQSVQNLRVLQRAMSLVPEDQKTATKISWGKYWIDRGFTALEQLLKDTSGEFCVGDTLSMADLCLVPQVYNANRFKVDMSKFPIISRINAKLNTLDVVKRAHPDAQPDANS